MTVNVNVNTAGIAAKFTQANLDRIKMDVLSERIKEDSNRYVPYETGALHDNVEIDRDGVHWTVDYAQYVYNMDDGSTNWTQSHGTEPHSHWFEVAKQRHVNEWIEHVERAFDD